MELTARRLAPALFGMLAFLFIAVCPCTARFSSAGDDGLDVPAPAARALGRTDSLWRSL
jgi:hypothetical protein